MDNHVHVQAAELRKLLLIASEDLVDNRLLPVNDLVVRERKHMTLVVEIHHGERQLLRALHALIGLLLHVVQRVVHPAEVPLVIEVETALRCRMRAALKCRRVLGDQHGRRMTLMQACIHIPDEIHRVAVHAAGLISHPVDNPADRVHAKTVEMIFRQPVVRRRLHEAADLASRENEVTGAPLTLGDIAVRIFVERRSVIHPQAVIVECKMRRNEVKDHTDAGLMQAVDQHFQLLCGPVSGCRREIAGSLIAPASIERILGERHHLDVRVIVFLHIFNQRVRELLVGIPAVRVRRVRLEGPEMTLIDIERLVIAARALVHPLLIVKCIVIHSPHNRRELRTKLHAESVRIAVLNSSVLPVDDEFVHLSFFGTLDEELIEARALRLLHFPFLPAVELADDGDLVSARRECAEHNTIFFDVRSEVLIRIKHRAHIKVLCIHYSVHFSSLTSGYASFRQMKRAPLMRRPFASCRFSARIPCNRYHNKREPRLGLP